MTSALRGEGGGVPSKADRVSNISKGGWVNLRTGGVKKSENVADVLYGSPLTESISLVKDFHSDGDNGSCPNEGGCPDDVECALPAERLDEECAEGEGDDHADGRSHHSPSYEARALLYRHPP